MPSTSQAVIDAIKKQFGNDFDDFTVQEYLTKAGYKLNKQWFWVPKEGVTNYEDMINIEYNCLRYLIEEWDYGGLVNQAGRASRRGRRPQPLPL